MVDTPTAVAAFVVIHGLAWGANGPLMNAIRADRPRADVVRGDHGVVVDDGDGRVDQRAIVAGVLADATGNHRLRFTILATGAACGTDLPGRSHAATHRAGDHPVSAATTGAKPSVSRTT